MGVAVPPTEERGSALEAFIDAASGILAADSLDGTLGRIAHHLRALVRYDDLTLYELDEPARLLRPVFAVGQWVEEVLAAPIRFGAGVTGRAVAERITRNVPNLCDEPFADTIAGTPDEPEALVCVPLLARGQVLGALNVYRTGNETFDDGEVALIERFATMAALAYDSARQRETLREQVQRDGLTGLLNHRACHERLAEELARGGPVAVVLIDLDHFKLINDEYGHAEGDRILAAAAGQLRSAVRAGDVVGRIGGEEFVLILPGAGADDAEDCAERARAALAELSVHGRPLAASAGVAAAPQDGRKPSVLLENGDAALYWAKNTGRDRTVRFVPGRVRPEAEQRAEVVELLARGTRAVRTAFQPIVELATGRPAGYEALARFNGEEPRGPDEWFAQAHRVGLGEELEALALRAALAAPNRPDGTFLALNVSPRALLSAPVRAALPTRLSDIVIELTEHELFGADGELEAELDMLRARGARVALDDAGAGYAGLQQIIRVAPDILKLDRALVHGAHADPSRQALLEALIGFAANTGAAICAEGVEDLADVHALVALDVTYAQGYGIARPGPPWPRLAPAAIAAGANEIRCGLRVASRPRGVVGEIEASVAAVADELAAAARIDELDGALLRAAGALGADLVSLMRIDHETDELVLVSELGTDAKGQRWPLADFPATRWVLENRVPGQLVLGDDAGDPAEFAELERLGIATNLVVPIVFGGRELAVFEVYRRLPRAFSAREIDRARMLAQQFGAALDRLT